MMKGGVMSYRKICLAVALQRYLDITPIGARLRDVAVAIARDSGAPLAVLSVEAPVELLPEVETMGEKLERFVEPILQSGIEVHAELREGRPSREIAAFVREVGGDLLVVGSHSKRSAIDVGVGSTASALLRELDEVPVLMVRPTAEEQDRAEELKIPRYPMVFPYG
jgi:nucleotide-binding universal stress UspA family protein